MVATLWSVSSVIFSLIVVLASARSRRFSDTKLTTVSRKALHLRVVYPDSSWISSSREDTSDSATLVVGTRRPSMHASPVEVSLPVLLRMGFGALGGAMEYAPATSGI